MIDYKALARNYAIALIALTVLVILIFEVFRWLLGIDPPGSIGVISMIVATIWPAQSFAHTYRRRPSGGEAWRIALIFTLISVFMSALIYFALLLIVPGMSAVTAQLFSAAGLTVMGMLSLIMLVALRFSFAYFARTQLKVLERQE